jgi:hypothetical protein
MNNPPLDEHEYFLGRLVVSFQSLELTLIEYLASLANQSDREIGYIISEGLSFKKLVTTVDALAKYRESTEKYISLNELLKNALKLEEERNKFVHGYWDLSFEQKRMEWVCFKRKNRLGKGHVFTQERLSTDLDDFMNRALAVEQRIRARISDDSE